MIETAVSAVDPTVIYVHSLHDNHQDHRAVAMATASATRGVRRIFAFQSPSATNDFKPTQFVPIDSVLQRKVQVLRMFASQKDRNYLDPELVVAGAKYWARHLGADARYAEPFEVIRSMGDLRQHAGIPTLVSDAQLGFALPSYSGLPPAPDGADLQFDWA
jgi:LmbE family N-acetylglucosaminyl deacetylase